MSILIWMFNSVIAIGVIARLFMFGEPVTTPTSKSSVSYWRSRHQANVYLNRVSDCFFANVDVNPRNFAQYFCAGFRHSCLY